jgi:hypothetical protein
VKSKLLIHLFMLHNNFADVRLVQPNTNFSRCKCHQIGQKRFSPSHFIRGSSSWFAIRTLTLLSLTFCTRRPLPSFGKWSWSGVTGLPMVAQDSHSITYFHPQSLLNMLDQLLVAGMTSSYSVPANVWFCALTFRNFC